jgi:hypothetical protein
LSFLDWVSMSILVDIACVVFFGAVTWKLRKTEKELLKMRSDINLVMKNPNAARRLLKERR